MSYNNNLKVVQYPHSEAVKHPKIPDATEASIGFKFKNKYSINAKNYTHMWFTPGLLTTIVKDTDDFANNTGLQFDWGINPADAKQLNLYSPIQKWRCISAGFTLTPVTTKTQIAGTWQAKRMVHNPHETNVNKVWMDNVSVTAITPASMGITTDDNEESVTFASGKISELGNFYFQLNDLSQDQHEWIDIKTMSLYRELGWTAGQSDDATALVDEQRTANNLTFDKLWDKNFDSIHMQFEAPDDNIMFKVDWCINIEIVPMDNHILQKICTRSPDQYTTWKAIQRRLTTMNKSVIK